MKDEEKTKKQLIDELAEMRKKMNELEKLLIQYKQGGPPGRGEELFWALIEDASDFITIIDGDGIIRYESPSVERKSGYKPEDLIGKRIFDIIHPDDLPKARDVFNRAIQNPDKTQSAEFRTRDSYDTWRILEAKVRNRLNHPIVKGMVVNSHDITGQRQAETHLRESENLYRTLAENSLTGIYMFRKRRYLFANEMYSKISGYSWDDLKFMDPSDLIAPEHRKQISERVEKWLAGEDVPFGYESQMIRKDGAIRDVYIKATRIMVEGKPAVLGNVIDITERKQAENWLRESESRFRDLVENSLTGIYIMQEGQIVYKNSEQDRIFGPLPQPYNFNNFKNVHPEDVEKVKEFYEKMMSGEIRNFDIDMRFFPTGEMDDIADLKWVHSGASVIKYQGREAILINMMDVTRTRELEHLMRIDDKMTSLGRAAAGIIHEVRNPLSGINVYLAALKKIYNQPEKIESESLGKVDEIIGKLQSASNKIESVIKRVMDFSKPSTPKLALTNINHSIQEALSLSSVTLQKSGIQLIKSLSENLPPCYTDSHLIEQVLLNLIMNAAQAMKNIAGEKIIEITSSTEGNLILIGVADSGPGVPPVLRKKIFDPFFTTKKDNAGIGLSVCHRIMTDHGGSLNVLTSKWGGAEFRIEIPIEKRKGVR